MLATVSPPAVYAGVREIQTGGSWYGEPAPARYDVVERYAVVRRLGRLATLRGTIVYTSAQPPADGIVLTTATIDQDERIEADGTVRMLSFHRTTHASHIRSGSIPSLLSDVRSVEMSFTGGRTMIPASLEPHRGALSLGATMRRTELDAGTPGSPGGFGTYAESDVRRTTSADGSFDETGSISIANWHRMRQFADGSASANDNTPGFSLLDVTVAAPEGTGPSAHVAVTVKRQGRTIGPTPIDTNDYVVPLWYAATWPAPLATATLVVEAPRPPDARCALARTPLVPVVVERREVDVAGRIVEEREERDLDRSRRMLCHLTSTTTRRYDVTSGSVTGAIIDSTVVHVQGPPSRV